MTITANARQLIQLLADGHFHSGTELAAACHLSRSAVWKQLQSLHEIGLQVIAVTGKGYRLPSALQLLDVEAITAQLSAEARPLFSHLEIHTLIDSTNSRLLELASHGREAGLVCLAEYQSAGKGRRGRHWVSPFAGNIYLSVLWRYRYGLAGLAGLSLAVGVAVVRVLRQLGIGEVGLKWPNDIYWRGRKLAGILIEVSGETGGPCHAVVGLGLNCRLSEQQAETIEQPWVDLQQIIGGSLPDRNRIAALLLNQLLPILADFEQSTLAAYLQEWRRYDCLVKQTVRLSFADQLLEGIVQGIDDQGLLLLEIDGQLRRFASGEVSVKLT